jgi:cell division protein FtsI (penicillin-binding protein 3)
MPIEPDLKRSRWRSLSADSSVTAIVMRPDTGEIVSLVSLPDFDPNKPGGVPDDARFNRATLGVYELGSVFKIMNTAMALDFGTTTLATRYDATKPIRVGRFQINDFHPENRALSVTEVFLHSSNIGSAKMALEVGAIGQRDFLQRLGMLSQLGIELPERGTPMFPAQWRPVNVMTISFGHGLSVSPLHMVVGVAATVNGGWAVRPTLLRTEGRPIGAERVMREETSHAMRQLMRAMVEDGTGTRAEAPGYLVGGKTGTAEKLNANGTYNRNARISSFVGAFPMQDPQYVIYVMLDEPKGNKSTFGYATAGWVAAPVVSKIVSRMAPLVGMRPFDGEAPEIRQDLALNPAQDDATLAAYRP